MIVSCYSENIDLKIQVESQLPPLCESGLPIQKLFRLLSEITEVLCTDQAGNPSHHPPMEAHHISSSDYAKRTTISDSSDQDPRLALTLFFQSEIVLLLRDKTVHLD